MPIAMAEAAFPPMDPEVGPGVSAPDMEAALKSPPNPESGFLPIEEVLEIRIKTNVARCHWHLFPGGILDEK